MVNEEQKKHRRRRLTAFSKGLLALVVFCVTFLVFSFCDYPRPSKGLSPDNTENLSITQEDPTYNEPTVISPLEESTKPPLATNDSAAESGSINGSTEGEDAEAGEQPAVEGDGQAVQPLEGTTSSQVVILPGTGDEAVSMDGEQEAAIAYVAALASGDKEYPSKSKSGKICQNPQASMMVALTFDDGPAAGMTQKYLEILAEYDVPATFFVLGQYILKTPETAKAIVQAGHEIASHSWYHHNLPKKEDDFITRDFQKTTDIFQSTLGKAPVLFRPPYGSIDERVTAAATAQGMLTVFWSLDPEDWQAKDVDTLVDKVTKNVKSGDIILLHENRKITLAALPKIIEKLQADGYQLVTVSRLLYEANQ